MAGDVQISHGRLVDHEGHPLDLDLASGTPAEGVPTGGDAGDILVKTSGLDYDSDWVDPDVLAETFVEDPNAPGTYVAAPVYVGETDPALGGDDPYVWMNPAEMGTPDDFVTHDELDAAAGGELVAESPEEIELTEAAGVTTIALTGQQELGTGANGFLFDTRMGGAVGQAGIRHEDDTSMLISFSTFASIPILGWSDGVGSGTGVITFLGGNVTLGAGVVLTSGDGVAATVNDNSMATTALVSRLAHSRHPRPLVGSYYQSPGPVGTTATAPSLDRMYLTPVWLPKGTLDRVGIEVSTLEATSVSRLGLYDSNALSGIPANLLGEATGTTDNSTLGNKELTISAVIPVYGLYYWAFVTQTASSAVRFRASSGGSGIPIPLGSTAPGTGANVTATRFLASVSGALPATTTGLSGTTDTMSPPRMFYRFSA